MSGATPEAPPAKPLPERWTVRAFLALQLVAAACLLQPWREDRRDAALVLFAVEALLLAALGLPIFLSFLLWRRQGVARSARATIDLVTEIASHLAPV